MRRTTEVFGYAMVILLTGCQFGAYASTDVPVQNSAGIKLKPKMAPVVTEKPVQPKLLQGGTAVYQQRDPYLEVWRASQLYQQGAYALMMQDPRFAAECFKGSGDAFELSIGEGRFLAESRFAEAQSRRLVGQIPQSARLFQIAADIFRRTDPYNPYLVAALQNLQLMGFVDRQVKPPPAPKKQAPSPAKLQLQAIQPKIASIDRTLKGGVTELADGTLIASLHDTDFFDGSKKQLPKIAGCDLSDKFLKSSIYNSFLEMTCLEFAALGANYTNAPDVYKPFLADGKPVLIGASEDIWESPTAKININGKEYNVPMTLPGINKYSHNVALITDGQHVLALEPRKNDIWKLTPVFKPKGQTEFNWWKLTHTKRTSIPTGKKPNAAPFAR
jgi:hypothetical protein